MIGTVGYMSPEHIHGRPADARSDIFSLGVVFYEAMSGRRAFHGETTAALLSSVLRDDLSVVDLVLHSAIPLRRQKSTVTFQRTNRGA